MNKTSLLHITIFDILLTAAFLLANRFFANGTKTQPLSTSILLHALFLFAGVFVLAFMILHIHLGKSLDIQALTQPLRLRIISSSLGTHFAAAYGQLIFLFSPCLGRCAF